MPKIEEAHRYFPVLVVTGPRQSGKTSLCRHLYPDYKYVNLEDITTRALAADDPAGFIDSLGHHAIIDEVQNVPEILSMIQIRVDDNRERRYVLTGSSNFSLLERVSQSLAGRAALFTLLPFSLPEVAEQVKSMTIGDIMHNGLYPGVVANGVPAELFYRNYYNTYVERDLRNLLNVKNLLAFDSFMRLLASRIGSEFNASAISREVGVSSVSVTEWMSILTTSYIAFPLRPFFTNVSKQLTKMPKVYFYDTGLACFLLGIENAEQLERSPFRGAIFENLAICELIKREYNQGKDPRINFYREKSGAEVDALLHSGGKLHLYEIKSGDTLRPDFTRNAKALAALLPDVASTTVIYNGPAFPPAAVNIRDI
ncbi:MAG: ATP-binding protein [Bacteroides sp.]|nr:ATP-binding protein [Bacteroides sp.]MBD5377238.1 ATP-binding protein [Bacteroides sp.]